MNEVDIITDHQSMDYHDDSNEFLSTYTRKPFEPIRIRGAGHVTVFALNNKFDEEYPQGLAHKVSRDEYYETIKKLNLILRKTIPNNFKWLLFGCICCCCTMGLSFCPVIYLNKRAQNTIEKLLDYENQRIYHRLGLHWHLTREKCSNNSVQEYVLMIEFRPPLSLSYPD